MIFGEEMFLYQKMIIPTKFIFFHPDGETGKPFRFSSDLEKVGKEWDVSIKNGTYVDVISGPVEISSPKYGILTLVKVKADVATDYHTIIKEFWVPTSCIISAEDNETSSSKLAN